MRKRKKLKSNSNIIIGKYSSLNNLEETQILKRGFDFRKPEYRREVFLRFYEFHLKYRSHPGGVYYVLPHLFKKYNFTKEQKYWYAFINGSTQNPCSSWVVFNKFPDFNKLDLNKFEDWHLKNWRRLEYDIDRRYVKGHLSEQVQNYKKLLNGLTQEQFFEQGLAWGEDPYKNFWAVWNFIMKKFFMYGRLSTFSYTEYLKILGLNIDCPELFMDDLTGSKSHRNGMCKVLGRDDLDWHKGGDIDYHYQEIVDWLDGEAASLLKNAKFRLKNRDFFKDVNYYTLESTLCCYKSWYRKNRRYPNVYNDMFFERIKYAENKGWEKEGINFDVMWEARKEFLPKYLRLEDNKNDPTFIKGNLIGEKQNHFRETGQVIMMDKEWDCFKNDFNDKYYKN